MNLDYTPTFTNHLLRKDLELGLEAARQHNVPLPLTALTHQIVVSLIGQGFGEQDFASLLEVAARGANLVLEPDRGSSPTGLARDEPDRRERRTRRRSRRGRSCAHPGPGDRLMLALTTTGNADLLALTDVPEPMPAPTEALVRVSTTSLNRGEIIRMQEQPRRGSALDGTWSASSSERPRVVAARRPGRRWSAW